MTAKEIVAKYLTDNGYDGLCTELCGCLTEDLAPCGCGVDDCVPGYRVTNAEGEWKIFDMVIPCPNCGENCTLSDCYTEEEEQFHTCKETAK